MWVTGSLDNSLFERVQFSAKELLNDDVQSDCIEYTKEEKLSLRYSTLHTRSASIKSLV